MWFVFGGLNDKQRTAMAPFIRGRVVTDLGAGLGGWSKYLVQQGATRVVAVDKISTPIRLTQVKVVTSYFVDFHDPVDVAFVSWPQNGHQGVAGLTGIIDRANWSSTWGAILGARLAVRRSSTKPCCTVGFGPTNRTDEIR